MNAALTTIGEAETLLERRDLPAAAGAFRRAAELGEDLDRCAAGLWMVHMLGGDYEAAWQQSDAVRQRGATDPHRFWQGEPLHGKRVILRCLHGFGDAVQMFRFLPALRARCAFLTLEVPPHLYELAQCFPGADDVITWEHDAPAWDVQVEVMELPYLLRLTTDNLLPSMPYLSLPMAARKQVEQAVGIKKRPRVGVVWSTGEWNRTRAIPFECVERLTQDTVVEWWNLQGGEAHADWSALPEGEHLRDGADAGDGLLPLAALIGALDLVITTDTLAAHLAGALGTPAWVLLQHAADWRWMHARSDAPWYPSLRLFRQAHQGRWASVENDVAAALAQWKRNV